MSLIVYGPQGCGKTLAAPFFRRSFNLTATWDDGNYTDQIERPLYTRRAPAHGHAPQLPIIGLGSLYPWVRHHLAEFKSSRILFITCEAPPQDLRHARRIVGFEDAIDFAIVMGIQTYLADWPRAQAINAITARALLDAIGMPAHLQTKPAFAIVSRVMAGLGWTRVRLRQPGEPLTWAYRPTARALARATADASASI